MSDAYRDELNAALAANESLRDELKTLKQSLEQERDVVRRQQEMLRANGVAIPRAAGRSDNRRYVILGVAVGLGLMCTMCAVGMVFFSFSRGSVSSVREEQHVLVPTPPQSTAPEVTPFLRPNEPSPSLPIVPSTQRTESSGPQR